MTRTHTAAPADFATAAPDDRAPRASKAAWWAGWIISATPILMIGVGGVLMNVFDRPMVEEGMAKHGYPPHVNLPLLVVAVASVILYAVPRTAVLGAILLTGYLGGATATHVRVGEPYFFPVIVGVLVWLGLYLRDPLLRALVPLRRPL